MPSASKNELRRHIKLVPLPISGQKGIKIQARCDTVYNPTEPSRDVVRKDNYHRRQQQVLNQGFRSVNFRPYQGIGDPFYLEERELALRALGQWDGNNEADSVCHTGSDEDENQQNDTDKPKSTGNFVLRRKRKDLNTLNKEVMNGREMMRNVRLGHSLFQLLRRQGASKIEAKQRAEQEKYNRMRNEWQPPRCSSDDEEEEQNDIHTSADEGEDNRLDVMSSALTVGTAGKVARLGTTPEATTICTSRMSSRKNQVPPRPYTPHVNIGVDNMEIPDSHLKLWIAVARHNFKNALFRQLCALYWLLEAMNVESSYTMGPITTCWTYREMGGQRVRSGKHEEQSVDKRWKTFTTNTQGLKVGRKRTSGRLGGMRGRRYSAHPRGSVCSTLPSPSGSISHLPSPLTAAPGTPNIRLEGPIPEHDEVSTPHEASTVAEEEDDDVFKTGLFKYLDEYYESMRKEEMGEVDDERNSTVDVSSARSDGSTSPHYTRRRQRRQSDVEMFRRASSRKNTASEIKKQMEINQNKIDDDTGLRSSRQDERRSASHLRAEHNVRPKSSPAVLEYQAKLPSNRVNGMALEMRQKFMEVTEEKALDLHDALEAVDRDRMHKIQSKFVHMPVGGSFYRALVKMRHRSAKDEETQDERRPSAIHQTWYLDLLSHIPDDVKSNWYFIKIMDKLSKYGLHPSIQKKLVLLKKQVQVDLMLSSVLEASQQNVYKFLKVLAGLRQWELCSPDISAAVEFCRERIVEMSVEEFEEWFHQQFPHVTRPQTAPPATNVKAADKASVKVPDRAATSMSMKHSKPKSVII